MLCCKHTNDQSYLVSSLSFTGRLILLNGTNAALFVLVRLQRRTGWRDLEHGARELWQLEVCSYLQLRYILIIRTRLLMKLFCSRPVHGLIFLFKWQPGEEPAGSIVQDSRLDHIFFAKQVCFKVAKRIQLQKTHTNWHNICTSNNLFDIRYATTRPDGELHCARFTSMPMHHLCVTTCRFSPLLNIMMAAGLRHITLK